MKRFLLLYLLVAAGLPAFSQYTINGDATQISCHCYKLTPDVGNKHGSVWNNNKINLNQSFDFTFNVFLGYNDSPGADGIVFVLQPISTSVGTTGGGMGYEGIPQSLGVTLDTYQNSNYNDPFADHIAIQLRGDINHSTANNVAGPVNTSASSINVEDGVEHTLRVVWDAPTQNITAYVDGVFRVSKAMDYIGTVFGSPNVYWGFTGATGGEHNEQRFCTTLTPAFTIPTTQKRCVNEPVPFTNTTTSFAPVASFSWDFGDGSPVNTTDFNPIHTYTTPGTFTIVQTVTGADGCVEVNNQSITIGSKPIAVITAAGGCINTTLSFQDASTVTLGPISNWYWDLGDNTSSTLQNPSDNYTVPGPKTLRLAVQTIEGCVSDTATKVINIDPEPTADFSFANNSCEGNSVQFNDLSAVSPGTITSWNWTFGIGPNSTLQNPTHVFPSPGTYVVTLTASTTGGCSKTISKNITILAKPTAYFKYGTVCQNAVTNFTDSSYSTSGGTINQWWWDLGNGQTSTIANPSVTYTTAGVVTVKLVVTNSNGCHSDTSVQTITVNGKPVASFTVTDSCVQTTILFTNTSTVTGGTLNEYFWDFDNTLTSTVFSPTTTYNSYGIKNVKLVVKTAEGCQSDTLVKPIRIKARPMINYTFTDSVCLGSPTFFTDQSTLADGPITFWTWTFDDSSTATHVQNPVHLYLTPGLHTVNVSASGTGSGDCLGAFVQKNVFVVNKPIAYFKAGSFCKNTSLSLVDSSYSTDGVAITSEWWDFGNGQTSTQHNPSVMYATSGPVTIKHVVTNAHGCRSDTFSLTVIVQDKPVAKFGYSNPLCNNVTISFSDSSTSSNGIVNQWSWLYNGAVFSTSQNTSNILAAGPQTIGLLVSAGGCVSDTLFKTIQVNPKPAVTFNFKDTCRNIGVSFSANSPVAIAQWNWNFGDNSISPLQNPTHAYTATGTYPVSLFALSANGCYSDTLKRNIVIFGTDANAGPDIIAASGQPVQLQATGGITYEWTPSFGLDNPFISNPVATLTADQTYTLKALTPGGCESYDQMTVKIYKGPEIYVPSAFTPNGDGNNDVLRALPVGISKFEYFTIFNRYGQTIFSTDDYSRGWDGTFKSSAQNSGTYVWIASAIDFRGNKLFRKGTVLLIR